VNVFPSKFDPDHTFGSHCADYVNTVEPMEQACHYYDVYHACRPHCDDCFVSVRVYATFKNNTWIIMLVYFCTW